MNFQKSEKQSLDTRSDRQKCYCIQYFFLILTNENTQFLQLTLIRKKKEILNTVSVFSVRSRTSKILLRLKFHLIPPIFSKGYWNAHENVRLPQQNFHVSLNMIANFQILAKRTSRFFENTLLNETPLNSGQVQYRSVNQKGNCVLSLGYFDVFQCISGNLRVKFKFMLRH